MKDKAEAPILWPPDMKSQLTGKDPDAGNSWKQKKKGAAEDEMVRWHHRLNGYELKQIQGDSGGQGSLVYRGGQGSLVYCSPWGHKELDTT